jgi:hypothetical protein
VPAGFTKPKAFLVATNTWVIRATRTKPRANLTILVSPASLKDRTGPGTLHRIGFNGKTATLYTVPKHAPGAPPYGNSPPEAEGPFSELTFERAPGQWIRIDANNAAGNVDMGVSDADLQKIAKGLVNRVSPVPDLLRFASIPAGFTFSDVWDGGRPSQGAVVQFAPPGAAPQLSELGNGGHAIYHSNLVVTVGSTADFHPQPRNPGSSTRTIRVAGRTVKIAYSFQPQLKGKPNVVKEIVIPLRKGQVVGVTGSSALGLSDEQLARFALGVSTGKDYRCCGK